MRPFGRQWAICASTGLLTVAHSRNAATGSIAYERKLPLTASSGLLRTTLFAVQQDHVEVASRLASQGWVVQLTNLAEKCAQNRASLAQLETLIGSEHSTISHSIEVLHKVGWSGDVSSTRVALIRDACRSYLAAEETLRINVSIQPLLKPTPDIALAAIRAIAAAFARVEKLPIQPTWRDRLLADGSADAWTDLGKVCSNVRTRLDEIENTEVEMKRLASIAPATASLWRRSSLPDWSSAMRRAATKEQALSVRARFLTAKAKVETYGLDPLIRHLPPAGTGNFGSIRELFTALYLRSCTLQAIREHPVFEDFKGSSPGLTRDRFRQLDKELKLLHRQELVTKLLERRPPQGVDVGLVKDRSEMGLLRHVVNLEKPRTTVRDLLRRAGRSIQALKPCFMMSPLSVAQLIDRGSLEFDTVIFDEASQVRPEDAISAIARCRQFVVVGDQLQLPPTSFGERSFGEDPPDGEVRDGEVEESAAVESILQLASATYGSGRTLLWHYRSRDPSLIAFSNSEFYRNELLLFPCPFETSRETGVKYVWVGGKYSARTNALEAKACASAALEFMRRSPDRSLGIVALNRPQADLIQIELDRLVHENDDAARYQAKWSTGLEPLFVKNLENVQGDERDTIFVSTVFAEDESGNFYQRFGPINSSAGHRRLNVLFTRAKYQLVVFSSLPTEKIVLSETSNWGVKALKQYLDFARTGRMEHSVSTGKSEDSPFEIAVRGALELNGYACEPQIGVAGFFVDLGVRHPRYPEKFLLGIECDGATYHSSRSARDRDRLRQEILENLGWKMYRIWSTDWYSDPHGELAKLLSHLEQLKSTPVIESKVGSLDFAKMFGKA